MAEEAERQVPEGAAVFPLIPSELDVDPLLLAVLHAAVFLSGSDDEVVHPAAATEALEYIATYLQRLSGPQIQRIREDLEVLTAFAKREGWPKQEVQFLMSFLADFGIGEGHTP